MPQPFGHHRDGRPVTLFTLQNRHGLRARVTDLGATLVSLEAPDRHGHFADITHGFDSAEGYLAANNPYFGATIGRFANRIRAGRFTLDGKTHQLATNNHPAGVPCHLHGGTVGFSAMLWSAQPDAAANAVAFTLVSPDGDEGYPGTLSLRVVYQLTDDNELLWQVTATTDAPTVVNLAHHPYWNLSGDPATSIDDHVLTLAAAHFLPTDAGLIPTGEIVPVDGTPMDFNRPVAIGARARSDYEALVVGGGYNHCWVLNPADVGRMRFAARVEHPGSGRAMEIFTDQPGVQLYCSGALDPVVTGKNGARYGRGSALCLETQNFPDAPNHPHFPSSVLRPGETYRHGMRYVFST